MKIGITLAELAASVQRIGAGLRAARLGKLPLQPQAPERPAPAGSRPPLGSWQGGKELPPDWPRWRFNCAGRVVYSGTPEQRRQWLTGDWHLEGTATGRLPSSQPRPAAYPAPAQSNDKRCVRCGQAGHRSSQCPQKWAVNIDFARVELGMLAAMTDAERQAVWDNAPPGAQWLIEEASGFTEAMWRNLPARCPWDDWKAPRELG